MTRTAKTPFGLVVGKRHTTKTGSRDKTSAWARSRYAICVQFLREITTKKIVLEQTLFVDEHTEFYNFVSNTMIQKPQTM